MARVNFELYFSQSPDTLVSSNLCQVKFQVSIFIAIDYQVVTDETGWCDYSKLLG